MLQLCNAAETHIAAAAELTELSFVRDANMPQSARIRIQKWNGENTRLK